MKILAIECSAGPASVAVIDDGKVIANSFINIKLTHSQTIMPMIESLLCACKTNIKEIEGIAVAAGPGSFTGIRIGISIAKGLSISRSLPCVAVSTLRGMAESFKGQDVIVCAVMDARCNQVYNALFKIEGENVTRLCEDRAVMCDELAKEIENLSTKGEKVVICGDGADLFYKYTENFNGVSKAFEPLKYQNANGIGLCAYGEFISGDTVSEKELLPIYLRLPQAERKLKKKQGLGEQK